MSVLDTLYERGFVHQLTHEEEIRELLAKEKITFYIGFDPTADCLHVGHFMQVIIMMYMQKYGHTPVVLIGGSRLKGYGDEHSDVDVTICMRPGADESRRTELLDKVMPLLGGEKPHEFWLEEAGQGLAIRLLDTDDQFVAIDRIMV